MPSHALKHGASRFLKPGAVAVLAILSLLPLRFIGWERWFGQLTQTLIAPVSHPFAALSRWLRPAAPRDVEDSVVRSLRDEIDSLTAQLLRERQENAKLLGTMEELYRLKTLNPDSPVEQLTAPVIAASSDLSSALLTVRAGERQGVEPNSVAVAPGLQLLGRVVAVRGKSCDVQPITSKAAEKLRARIIIGDDPTMNPLCQLEPRGDGTFRGPVSTEGRDPASALKLEPGQLVRLDDQERWPRHAQMLVIGRIESVDASPDQPLRKVVTVRPTLSLDRVSEVVLRIAGDVGEFVESRPAVNEPPSAKGARK